MQDYMEKYRAAADYIGQRITGNPQTGIILGTGLGPLVDFLEETTEIDYRDIPGFPQTTVEGHAGKLVCGTLGGKRVLVMKGRFHFYEGYEMDQVVFHIRVFKLLGISQLIVTNAAGGINSGLVPGDLMLITDHISFFAPSPLRGGNLGELGPRFPDMCKVYDAGLIAAAKRVAAKEGIPVREGVYAFAQGPMFETPAEIRALKVLGADAVGMSTVPEVIVARHADIKVLGISCITNMAAGVLDEPIKHDEVLITAKKAEKSFVTLVRGIVENGPF
jgi:purine-nucleoside phosphorylase